MATRPFGRRLAWTLLAGAALILLVGCATQTASIDGQNSRPKHEAKPNTQVFTSARYDFRIQYPAKLKLRRTFPETYQLDDDWKTFTGPDAPPGQAVVALILPGSNEVTTGAIRIGASRNETAVRNCTNQPFATRPNTVGQTVIDGVTFTTYRAGGAGMSHYLTVRSYRAVHNGTCYAIDILVYGTNPHVYAPPRTPPFTHKQAYSVLTPVVQGLQFASVSASEASHSPIKPPATYTGLLPCADCPGIAYQLNLRADHRYVLRLIYRDRDTQFTAHGHWHLSADGNTLILERNGETERQWAVSQHGKQLRLLNAQGEPIQSKLNFSLHRSPEFHPLP